MFDWLIGGSNNFSVDRIPDLKGKTAIVTGATTGLGFATAVELVRHGASVTITVRSKEKGEKTVAEIKSKLNQENVSNLDYALMDNSSLKSVDEFGKSWEKGAKPLHILVNNAGIGMPNYNLTDGIESQIMVNYLSHYHLTNLLLPSLLKAASKDADARIVNVSSVGHNFAPQKDGKFELERVSTDEKNYSAHVNYGASKLAQIHHVKFLSKKYQSENLFANALHPGGVNSEIMKGKATPSWVGWFIGQGITYFGVSPEHGALTQLYLATSPEVKEKQFKGKYFVPTAVETEPSKLALSEENITLTIEWSDKMIKKILGK